MRYRHTFLTERKSAIQQIPFFVWMAAPRVQRPHPVHDRLVYAEDQVASGRLPAEVGWHRRRSASKTRQNIGK